MDEKSIIISNHLTQSNICAYGADPHLKRLTLLLGRFKALWPFATQINGGFKEGMTEGV